MLAATSRLAWQTQQQICTNVRIYRVAEKLGQYKFGGQITLLKNSAES